MEQVPGRNSISPEEKLFNVIRAGKKETNASVGEKAPVSELTTVATDKQETVATTPHLQQDRQITSFSPTTVRRYILGIQKLHPYIIYSLLSIILAILIIVAGYTIVSERPDITEVIDTVRKRTSAHSLITFTDIEPFKQIEFYLQEAGRRNIFQPVPDEPEGPMIKEKPKEDTKKKLQEIIQTLTLRGISWGDEPKAIIKDKDGQLYFLKEGQPIGTSGARIKKIEKEKVIIQYKDAQSEM